MEERKSQNNNRILIPVIVILSILVLGMGIYIAYNKGLSSAKIEKEVKEEKSNIKKEDKQEENKQEELEGKKENNNETKPLDLLKCLNNRTNTYSNPSDVALDYGLSMQINPDKRSILINIDFAKFGPISSSIAPSIYANQVETYQITGFSKNVQSAFVGELGQSASGITLFYLMEDGTVEYTPIFSRKKDSHNNQYYVVNFMYDSPSNVPYFTTAGTISGVSSVTKLYNVDAHSGAGWRTTIGAKSDGSFYDLGAIIN